MRETRDYLADSEVEVDSSNSSLLSGTVAVLLHPRRCSESESAYCMHGRLGELRASQCHFVTLQEIQGATASEFLKLRTAQSAGLAHVFVHQRQ